MNLMNNINDVITKPLMFGATHKSQYALCFQDGNIHQIFTTLDSAKYLLTNYNLGYTIYEVITIKDKIIANLGEIYVGNSNII
jgi:hypothetical protein